MSYMGTRSSRRLRRLGWIAVQMNTSLRKVRAPAVGHTELRVVDGELPHPKPPLVAEGEIAGVQRDRPSQKKESRPGYPGRLDES
jgi:hypothetical protein